ncbi:Putative ribonuclease H protein At1g65750, partial [Linum perenne]
VGSLVACINTWTRWIEEATNKDDKFFGPSPSNRLGEIFWGPGPPGFVTVNTDGSVQSNPSSATTGGLGREESRRFHFAFTSNLGSCSVTRVELRGAIHCLEMAWNNNFIKIQLQLDSQVAIQLLQTEGEILHHHATEF